MKSIQKSTLCSMVICKYGYIKKIRKREEVVEVEEGENKRKREKTCTRKIIIYQEWL